MKKKIVKLMHTHIAAVLIGFLILATLLFTIYVFNELKENVESVSKNLFRSLNCQSVFATVNSGEEFIIKEYENRIGVFAVGDTVPLRVEQIYVAHLPEKDRAELKRGIYVTGEFAMEKLLNDYSS